MSRQSGISASLQHKGQKIFMVAIPTLHPGKAVVQVATIQAAVNDLLEVGSPEPVGLLSLWSNVRITVKNNLDYIFVLV